MTETPAARPECEHYWAYHCYGGLSVRLCRLCHEPDWADVRRQQAGAVAAGRERYEARIAVLRQAATDWAARAPADDWGESGSMADTVIADVGREILRLLADDVPGVTVDGIRAAERSRIAASLRSLPVLEFLARHGLRPGAGTARVLCAIAAEIEGPGAPGCEHHPGPPEVILVRPKVSRRGRQEDGGG